VRCAARERRTPRAFRGIRLSERSEERIPLGDKAVGTFRGACPPGGCGRRNVPRSASPRGSRRSEASEERILRGLRRLRASEERVPLGGTVIGAFQRARPSGGCARRVPPSTVPRWGAEFSDAFEHHDPLLVAAVGRFRAPCPPPATRPPASWRHLRLGPSPRPAIVLQACSWIQARNRGTAIRCRPSIASM
jgi:hypothetical protein